MPDIRERVEEDRGLLKKIQGYIPGYKGYREREDLRIADSLLREQLANQMDSVVDSVQRTREILSKNMEMDLLNDIGELNNGMEALANKIRHAEQGYSGFSAGIRIEQQELANLYDFDLNLLQIIDILMSKSNKLEGLTMNKSVEVPNSIRDLKKEVQRFEELLDRRIETISNIAVRR